MNILTTNYSKLFYWLTVADNAKSSFVVFVTIFTIVAVVATICYIFNSELADTKEAQSMSRRWMWWSYPFCILFWFLYVFTPSKKDALLIVAGGQTLNFLTTDSSTKKIPAELSSFVLSELKNMAKEAKVELSIETQKEKVLESAKEMTGLQLVEKIKSDSFFRKIILEK